MLLKKKNMVLNPKIAMIFELKTIKGSVVMAKIAGILSKANNTSVISMIIRAKNKGVAAKICFLRIKKCWFSTLEVIGTNFLTTLKVKEFLILTLPYTFDT